MAASRQHQLKPDILGLRACSNLGCSAPIRFGSFNQKCGSRSQRQQILIAAHQNACVSALSQIQKRLIVSVAANDCAFIGMINYLAVKKIVGQQFSCIVGAEPEFWVTENSREFCGGCARDQGHASTFAPMLTQPS